MLLIRSLRACGPITTRPVVAIRHISSTMCLRQTPSNFGQVDNSEKYNPAHQYPAPNTYVESDIEPSKATGRPVPINVALNSFAPIRHELTHGHKVAEVYLSSFTTQNLDFYCDFLLRSAFYLKIPVRSVSKLPNKIKRWTVIKSPFAHAKSKENFERITHRRVLKLYDANPDIVQIFLATARKYCISGVGIKATLFNQESLEMIENLDSPSLDASSPLSTENVNLSGADQEVAQAVLDILKEPQFKDLMDEGKIDSQ